MTDKEILSLFRQKGQAEKAFNELLKVYQERLYWHVRRMVVSHSDADDVLQNTFLKIWKGLDKFRADSGLFTWLYRIATNEALSFIKQRSAKQINVVNEAEDLVISRLEADEYFDGDEIQKKLYAVLETLPRKQKLVFEMKYFQDLKYQEISEILETSVGALKASYHHAVKKIEHAFKED
ncbi:MAG: RNA polymerase sigma factor [Bacteroidetes bacterium]|jgi:RNA polymerase sigma-70 factor, ECF subfamily|nr:RNA polymerase sigma factor [Bacteroidota bacterium]MBT3749581.1 RNA polymerase sigma factor [Bacteroidota bacterium]MBT4399432.1 RNA polymerase sigma factor [Bacteroidota bacterium]MBT4410025.1 RNA polymerase sigma factor [Bacteroidota bacterium]MBT5425777.1 RNA polymerase sigma factor [Bacteroidota bacterium]